MNVFWSPYPHIVYQIHFLFYRWVILPTYRALTCYNKKQEWYNRFVKIERLQRSTIICRFPFTEAGKIDNRRYKQQAITDIRYILLDIHSEKSRNRKSAKYKYKIQYKQNNYINFI